MISIKKDNFDKTKKVTSEISNDISRKIIFSIILKAKSGIEIANDTELSQSTVYQKLIILKDLSLVKIDHEEITEKGRHVEFFKSNISKGTPRFTRIA
ncbi:transcriptional regulator protein [Marine Group I thaumarchaeote SCGC AAA799-B03]|uniref:Transcriptional regulator protein n=1 Tax=Marine Group I thaumarchaeote SCGC AAA799-B03 TaxID=1502289 RepID=A0A087S6K5_9ARCH|nr:transcriptional regulator protein [Marine Group I thaumarchaeote SCGC AAA799-B03]